MYSAHPDEGALARMAEADDGAANAGAADAGAANAEMLEHLRWCARCRTRVADYRWLQDELVGALGATADAVRVPHPRWWAVREGLITTTRQRSTASRVSALASAVLAVCLMFFRPLIPVPSLLGTTQPASPVWMVSYPEAVIATAPTAAVSSSTLSESTAGATPTPNLVQPGRSREVREAISQPTPVYMQLPTPPQPQTLNL
jgi:hypothetical protein